MTSSRYERVALHLIFVFMATTLGGGSAFALPLCKNGLPDAVLSAGSKVAAGKQKCFQDFAAISCEPSYSAGLEREAASGPLQTIRLRPDTASILDSKEADLIRYHQKQLYDSIEFDRKLSASPTDPTLRLSSETVARTEKLNGIIQRALEAQGFEVKRRKVKEIVINLGGRKIAFPSHEALTISAGKAKGPLARELKRIETEMKLRMKDAKIPEQIRNQEATVDVATLLTALDRNMGLYAGGSGLGSGLQLSPSVLIASQDFAVEIMRHELRHAKTRLDLLAGRPTLYRATLIDPTDSLVDPKMPKSYRQIFAVDEIYGFKANVRVAQTRLRKEVEEFQRLRSMRTMSPSLDGKARNSIEALSREADRLLNFVENFATSSRESLNLARAKIADPMMSRERFEAQITRGRELEYPGQTAVSIKLSADSTKPGRVMKVYVPEEVNNQGSEALRHYLIDFFNQLDTHLERELNEVSVRRREIQRLSAPVT